MLQENEQNNMQGNMPSDNPAPSIQSQYEPPKMIESPKKKIDKNIIFIGVAVLAVLITGVLVFANTKSGNFLSFLKVGPSTSKEAVVNSAIDYLNNNLLQGQKATAGDISEESGIIKFKVKIDANTYDSYITKDGKLFFPQAYNLNPTGSTGKNNQQGGVDSKNVKTAGSPFIGQQNAPVVMAYWYDYQCPFCKRSDQEVIGRLLTEYVNTGKLKIVFKQYAFLGTDSTTAALAERAIWEIAPNKFYQWHKAMLDKQDAENGGWGNKSDILALTASIGIDSVKVGQLMTSKATEYQAIISADKAEGSSFGIDGTPGAVIGAKLISGAQPYDAFKSAIEVVLGN